MDLDNNYQVDGAMFIKEEITVKHEEIIAESEENIVNSEEYDVISEKFEDHCVICKVPINNEYGEWMNIMDSYSTKSNTKITDILNQLVFQKFNLNFFDTTICQKCFHLIDRADDLQMQMKGIIEEIDNIKEKLSLSISILTPFSKIIPFIQKNPKDDSNEHYSKSLTGLTCMICLTTGYQSKTHLAQHFDVKHSKHCVVECHLCHCKLSGGVKMYLLHMASQHPNTSITKGQAIIQMDHTLNIQKDVPVILEEYQNSITKEEAVIQIDSNTTVNSKMEGELFEDDHHPISDNCDYTPETNNKDKLITNNKSKIRSNLKKTRRVRIRLINCLWCHKSLSRSHLKLHIIDKHRNGEKYNCPQCHEIFSHIDKICNHINLLHQLHLQNNNQNLTVTDYRNKCDDCGKMVTSLEIHKHNVDLEIKAIQCAGNNRSRMKILNNLKLLCKHCGLYFKRTRLPIHINDKHTLLKNYACNRCNETFKKHTHLRTHKRHIHNIGFAVKKFMCNFCGLLFLTPYNRKKHILIVHENKRDHLCEICGDKFHLSQTLVKHKYRHSGFRPFVCKICSNTFICSRDVRNHVLKVHNIECRGTLLNPFTRDTLAYEKITQNLTA